VKTTFTLGRKVRSESGSGWCAVERASMLQPSTSMIPRASTTRWSSWQTWWHLSQSDARCPVCGWQTREMVSALTSIPNQSGW